MKRRNFLTAGAALGAYPLLGHMAGVGQLMAQ